MLSSSWKNKLKLKVTHVDPKQIPGNPKPASLSEFSEACEHGLQIPNTVHNCSGCSNLQHLTRIV